MTTPPSDGPAHLDPPPPDLVSAAVSAAARSHSPYSGFPVGAAVLTTSGEVFSGCNVENASYPEGWCAETSAIAQMVSTLGSDARIATIVTTAPGDDDGTPGTPCGGCRQRIREFATPDTVIHATVLSADGSSTTSAVVTMAMDELLPSSFGPERLR